MTRYSTGQKRWKYSILIGGGIVVAGFVAYFSIYAPAVKKEDVQGAIAKRDVYRDPNASTAEVASSGAGDAKAGAWKGKETAWFVCDQSIPSEEVTCEMKRSPSERPMPPSPTAPGTVRVNTKLWEKEHSQ